VIEPTSAAAAATTSAVAACTTWWSLRRTAGADLVGDEHEYAAVAEHRPGPAPFQRMPGYPWLLRRCGTVRRARLTSAVGSVAATAAATAAAVRLAGGWAGLLAGLLMATAAERILLSARMWPDPLAAAGHAVLVAACLPGGPVPWWPAAIATGALVVLRIDALATTACLAIALPGPWWQRAAVALSGVAALLLASAWRRARGARGPIDTTAWFNLRLAAGRLNLAGRSLEADIADLAGRWDGEDDGTRRHEARRAAARLLRHPLRLAVQILRRAAGLLGPDSFGRQRLLPSYPQRPAALVDLSLCLAGPAIVVLAAAGTVAAGAGPPAALVGLQLLALAVLHTRTRYRAVLLPGLTVLAAAGIDGLREGRVAALVGAAIGLTLTALGAFADPEGGKVAAHRRREWVGSL